MNATMRQFLLMVAAGVAVALIVDHINRNRRG
jgi:hypothetical protein